MRIGGTQRRQNELSCLMSAEIRNPSASDIEEIEPMKAVIAALVLLVGTASIALAQSQPNFGPSGPGRSDCFGEPYSGSVAGRCGGYHHFSHHHYYRYR
jgi:hypothetical protein